MKKVTTTYRDGFVTAVMEITRIFDEPADFVAIVEKCVGEILEQIAITMDQLITLSASPPGRLVRCGKDKREAHSVTPR